MLGADAIIFTTPVFVVQTTGAVKAFLDHYGFIFIGHRSCFEMKTIVTNLKFWGINRIYSLGLVMRAASWDAIKSKRKKNLSIDLKSPRDGFIRRLLPARSTGHIYLQD